MAQRAKETSILMLCELMSGMHSTKPNYHSKLQKDEVGLSERAEWGQSRGFGEQRLAAHLLHKK